MSFAHVVLVGSGVGHLDQAYTYRIPEDAGIHVGSLLRIPVRGRSREGVVVRMLDEPDVARVQPIRAVLGPGLTPDLVSLAHGIAEHYLSSFGEAIGAAVPPRVAEEETGPSPWPAPTHASTDLSWTGDYKNGRILVTAIRAGGFRAFAWRPLAHFARGPAVAALAGEALRSGRGVLVLVPEVRIPSSVVASLSDAFGEAVAWIGSDRSPRERYRAWLALRRGEARIAAGGRAAVFAPVPNLGLVVVDDEGHVSYKERRSPRFHARPVAFGRAKDAGAAFLAVGVPPSFEVAHAVERNMITPVVPSRATELRSRPAVVVVDRTKEDNRHTPSSRTLAIVKASLERGRRAVVLVHRAGEEARAIAARVTRVLAPQNPARLDSRTLLKDPDAFASALAHADLIVSTPVIAKDLELSSIGCIAVVEADAALASPEFRAAEESFATWWRAGRWLDPDGTFVIETTHPRAPAVAALVRWDPDSLWRAEKARRAELSYPPFGSLVRIECPPQAAAAVNAELTASAPEADIMGPIEDGRDAVFVMRSRDRHHLIGALRPVADRWRKEGTGIRIDVDPRDVLR